MKANENPEERYRVQVTDHQCHDCKSWLKTYGTGRGGSQCTCECGRVTLKGNELFINFRA